MENMAECQRVPSDRRQVWLTLGDGPVVFCGADLQCPTRLAKIKHMARGALASIDHPRALGRGSLGLLEEQRAKCHGAGHNGEQLLGPVPEAVSQDRHKREAHERTLEGGSTTGRGIGQGGKRRGSNGDSLCLLALSLAVIKQLHTGIYEPA